MCVCACVCVHVCVHVCLSQLRVFSLGAHLSCRSHDTSMSECGVHDFARAFDTVQSQFPLFFGTAPGDVDGGEGGTVCCCTCVCVCVFACECVSFFLLVQS